VTLRLRVLGSRPGSLLPGTGNPMFSEVARLRERRAKRWSGSCLDLGLVAGLPSRASVKARSTRSSSRPRYQPRREPGFLQGTDSIDGGADGASAGCVRERVAGFSGWDIGTAARRGPPDSRPRRAVRLEGRGVMRPAGRGPPARAGGRAVDVLAAGPGTPAGQRPGTRISSGMADR
jgi:hypothetical protein